MPHWFTIPGVTFDLDKVSAVDFRVPNRVTVYLPGGTLVMDGGMAKTFEELWGRESRERVERRLARVKAAKKR
jgi:hypothetical protein